MNTTLSSFQSRTDSKSVLEKKKSESIIVSNKRMTERPVKLQKSADFESLVKTQFPHLEWEFSSNTRLNAFYKNADDAISVSGLNQTYGSPDTIKQWVIDCHHISSGKTLEEALGNWKVKFVETIDKFYLPQYDFEKQAIRLAQKGGKKLPARPIIKNPFYNGVLSVMGLEWGRDIPIPVDPYLQWRE